MEPDTRSSNNSSPMSPIGVFVQPKKRKVVVLVIIAFAVAVAVTVFILLNRDDSSSEPLKSSDALVMDVTVGGGDFPQATVVWSGISASSYDYECSANEDFTNAKKETVVASLGVCQNLDQFSDYFVRVKPEGYEWSQPKSFSTTGDIVIVTGLAASVNSDGVVALSWDPVDGSVTYEVQYSPDQDFTSITETVTSDAATAQIANLDQEAYYFRVRVAASGASAGATPYSVPVLVEVR